MNKRVESAMTHRERIPYQLPQPAHMRPDQVVLSANPAPDDRHWVPLNEGIWLRPLQFNVSLGQYTHMMRVTKSGVIARHRHSGAVHAHVIKGKWLYLEHDWVAEEGSYI